jgi:hypothetical protein
MSGFPNLRRNPIRVVSLFGAVGWLALSASAQPPDAPPNPTETEFQKRLKEAWEVPTAGDRPGPKEESKLNETERLRRKLVSQRWSMARREFNQRMDAYQAGTTAGVFDGLIASLNRLAEAEAALPTVAMNPEPADVFNAYERAIRYCDALLVVEESRNKAGRTAQYQIDLVNYTRLTMKIKLLEAQKQIEAKGMR